MCRGVRDTQVGEEGGEGEEMREEEVWSHVAPHRHRLWNVRLNSLEWDNELLSICVNMYMYNHVNTRSKNNSCTLTCAMRVTLLGERSRCLAKLC